jgi:hypothetical protein
MQRSGVYKLFVSEIINAPHQLNEPLTYMPIADRSHSWQEKMCRTGSPGPKIYRTPRHGITAWMDFIDFLSILFLIDNTIKLFY